MTVYVNIKMAKMLNTSTNYLLDLTDNPNPIDLVLTERENSLLMNYRNLNSEEKIRVETYLQALLDLKETK